MGRWAPKNWILCAGYCCDVRRLPMKLHTLIITAALLTTAFAAPEIKPHDGKPADMAKPVQVFILLGQSNMVGLGKVGGPDGSLEFAVKEKKKYPYLVDEAGAWIERKDVRYARVMSGRGGGMQRLNNEWMTVKTCKTIGPEFGIAPLVGDAIEAPVLILKSCIGNRSLSWDLLPPGSERYEFTVKDKAGVEKKMIYAGYKDKPDSWEMDPAKGLKTEPGPWVDKTGKPIDWYAGKQWDDDLSYAKTVLSELDKHYPGATKYEVAGFFFWQGEKDAGNPGHAARYEQNLVHFIKSVRKEFNAPNAKFVLATMGESVKGGTGNGALVLDAHLAVDGASGKYPEFKGNVATIYTHPMAQGGSGNGHYGGKAEVYMDVGEAMGRAMVEMLKTK
jgi:Carbohydrate esterase, sialic acid-specific acetylesterase